MDGHKLAGSAPPHGGFLSKCLCSLFLCKFTKARILVFMGLSAAFCCAIIVAWGPGRRRGLVPTDDLLANMSIQPLQHLLIDTESCKIPAYDLWHPSIKNYVGHETVRKCYESKMDATYVSQDTLHLRIPNGYNATQCSYQPIRRVANDDYHNQYDSGSQSFSTNITLNPTDNYIKVMCMNAENAVTYINFYAFARPMPNPEKDSSFKEHKAKHDETLNILLLGVDSLSQSNFQRQYRRTREHLLKKLNAIEMKGATKVGENSFPNMTPFMTGKTPDDFPRNNFGKWPFVWKQYATRGYSTFYSEDFPLLNIWNMDGKGFPNRPCDYYFRPLALELVNTTTMWTSRGGVRECFGQRSWSDMTLDYLNQSLTTWKGGRDRPFFAFHFSTLDSPHESANCDEALLKYLQYFETQRFLDNTLLVLFGDHGVRWGQLSQTMVGNLEGRMPALVFRFPERFRKEYPFIIRNVEANSYQLTSHFDTYKTLWSFLDFDASDYRQDWSASDINSEHGFGLSLLRRIPDTRVCSEAGIPQHWCPCQALKKLSTKTNTVQSVAQGILHLVNSIIQNVSSDTTTNAALCAPLTLQKAVKAYQRPVMTKVDTRMNVTAMQYMVTIRTIPGKALISGSGLVSLMSGALTISHDFTRTNTYGTQSSCVQMPTLKLICYCVNSTVVNSAMVNNTTATSHRSP